MPTVLEAKGYRFFFFKNDTGNLPHVHIESGNKYAIFWLKPVELEKSTGYDVKEISEIKEVITSNLRLITEKWNGYFS